MVSNTMAKNVEKPPIEEGEIHEPYRNLMSGLPCDLPWKTGGPIWFRASMARP